MVPMLRGLFLGLDPFDTRPKKIWRKCPRPKCMVVWNNSICENGTQIFPLEILDHIFSYLAKPKDFACVLQVCKCWNYLLCGNASLPHKCAQKARQEFDLGYDLWIDQQYHSRTWHEAIEKSQEMSELFGSKIIPTIFDFENEDLGYEYFKHELSSSALANSTYLFTRENSSILKAHDAESHWIVMLCCQMKAQSKDSKSYLGIIALKESSENSWLFYTYFDLKYISRNVGAFEGIQLHKSRDFNGFLNLSRLLNGETVSFEELSPSKKEFLEEPLFVKLWPKEELKHCKPLRYYH